MPDLTKNSTGSDPLLALARLSPPFVPLSVFMQKAQTGCEAHRLLTRLKRLRLASLAWHNVRAPDSPWRAFFSPAQRQDLHRCYTARTAAALQAHAAMRLVQRAFAPAPRIDFMPIKGFAASALLYPHPALRPLGDVDLWVDPKNFAEARARLAQAGYTGAPKPGADFVVQLRHPRMISLDLHCHLRQPQRLQLNFADVYARGQRRQVADLELVMPNWADLFIVQAYSLASGELVESFNAWVDLRELLVQPPQLLADPQLWTRIDAAGLGAASWAVLWRLGQMWPELDLGLPRIRRIMPVPPHALALAAILPTVEEILAGQRLPRLRQLAVKALLMQDARRALGFLRGQVSLALGQKSR